MPFQEREERAGVVDEVIWKVALVAETVSVSDLSRSTRTSPPAELKGAF